MATLELGNLCLSYPGYQAQMVISTPLLFASFPPTAHVTMLNWLRIELGARLLGHRAIKASSYVAVVGSVIGSSECFLFVVRPWGDNIGALGC